MVMVVGEQAMTVQFDQQLAIVKAVSDEAPAQRATPSQRKRAWFIRSSARVLTVIKFIYLPPTYLHFIQDIEDGSRISRILD
jgi:hypothetical protein